MPSQTDMGWLKWLTEAECVELIALNASSLPIKYRYERMLVKLRYNKLRQVACHRRKANDPRFSIYLQATED